MQTSSILTRLLLSVYFFLTFLFFTEVSYGALISLIPFAVPYDNKCLDCGHMFYRFFSRLDKAALFKCSVVDQCVWAFAPCMLVITGLIHFFPYTGLGLIVALPAIYLVNSAVIAVGFTKRKIINRGVSITTAILLTLLISILLYPQEFNPPVTEQIWDLTFGK